MNDVGMIADLKGSFSKERNVASFYPTQKPESILERVIKFVFK